MAHLVARRAGRQAVEVAHRDRPDAQPRLAKRLDRGVVPGHRPEAACQPPHGRFRSNTREKRVGVLDLFEVERAERGRLHGQDGVEPSGRPHIITIYTRV